MIHVRKCPNINKTTQWHTKFANKCLKVRQIPNKLSKNCRKFLRFCQSEKISPNLVTLLANRRIKIETVLAGSDELALKPVFDENSREKDLGKMSYRKLAAVAVLICSIFGSFIESAETKIFVRSPPRNEDSGCSQGW